MLDLKLLREKPEEIKAKLKRKFVDPVKIDNILSLDAEKRNLQAEAEALKAKQNRASEKIPALAKDEREKLLREMQYLKEQIGELNPKIEKLDGELKNLLITLPNIPWDGVPDGPGEEGNVVTRTYGEKPVFDFEPKDHTALGLALDLIDTESAGDVSGSRFYYLKNDLVMLEFALVQFVMNKLRQKGFSPVLPPVLVKEKAMYGTGFFPADRNEIYHVNPEDDDLYLVGTSEVALGAMHQEQILTEDTLPLRYAGFSTCFRREAGAAGKDTRGILRVHQFDKVEMFVFARPEDSEKEHEMLIGIEEEIMQDLGFHYQRLEICTGELKSSPAARKVDLEIWIPTQNKFRELTSCSNCTDFQARRLNIRVKRGVAKGDGTATKGEIGGKIGKAGSNEILHTLNGTAMASTRTLIAIMENYQTKDGNITIPEVLRPYMGGQTEIVRRTTPPRRGDLS